MCADRTGDARRDAAPGKAAVVLDGRGRIRGWTPAARAALGHTADDVMGRPFSRLVGVPEDSGSGQATVPGARTGRPAPQGGAAWEGLRILRRRDGTDVWADLRGEAVCSVDGEEIRIVEMSFLPPGEVPPPPMRALLDHSPVALAVWDTDLRCAWLNTYSGPGAAPLGQRAVGVGLGDSFPGFDMETLASVMRTVLSRGEPVVDHEFQWVPQDGGEERVYSASFARIEGADGTPMGVFCQTTEITSSLARARLRLVSEAARKIGTTLDVTTTAQELADAAVPLLADFVAVELAESVPLGDLEPLDRLESGESFVPLFRRAGLASIHEGAPEAAYRVKDPVFVKPTSPFFHAVTTGESWLEPRLRMEADSWLNVEQDRARTLTDFGIHSMMIAPLKARGVNLGVAVFLRTHTPAPFTKDDLFLAEGLALHAALTIDNARQYTRERKAALALQNNLLPRRISGGPGLEVASHYLPAATGERVGGDWYDAIHLTDGRTALVIGDVTGQGIGAAATMGRLGTAVRTLALLGMDPDELLTHLDRLARRMAESEPDGVGDRREMVASCLCAVYDPVARTCRIAAAGHPAPLLTCRDGRVHVVDVPGGEPVGRGRGLYAHTDVTLEAGDILTLYTNGLIASSAPGDGEEGLARLVRSAGGTEGPLDELCADVIDAMTGRVTLTDDVALLMARARTPEGRDAP